ncbi:GNAT family N-acetyltransferase [Brevibacillus choshinensis]|uniref:GNAT family N-acetyltransferase n=1 Tax=Brevibacillus choshinensis TaxID=54911 RepID=UPI002E20004E|nr:GNAT family N-acetyltransferase [Brevibacillus choshinensis]
MRTTIRNHLDLMTIQAEVLFVHDRNGRLIGINEPDRQPAPRLFWGKTRTGDVLRFQRDVPDHTVAEIQAIMKQDETPEKLSLVIRTFEKEQSINRIWMGPAYACFTGVTSPTGAILVTEQNQSALEAGFSRLLSELPFRKPCYMVTENDVAVSVCFCARSTDRAAEAGVETLEDYRGRGYAALTVSSWCRAIYESQRIPLYSTSWDNYASMSVAKRLNFTLYGTDISIY